VDKCWSSYLLISRDDEQSDARGTRVQRTLRYGTTPIITFFADFAFLSRVIHSRNDRESGNAKVNGAVSGAKLFRASGDVRLL
jgi:hypothetical protein